jgi:DNA-directed RNA polymerase specialized sigma24 family protein
LEGDVVRHLLNAGRRSFLRGAAEFPINLRKSPEIPSAAALRSLFMEPNPPSSHETSATQWSLIDAVAAGDREALNSFVERYLPAFRNYLVRVLRGDRDELDDLLQQFVQEKLLEQNLAAQVNREVGFRRFVYRSLKNFVIDHFRRQQRREGNKISLDDEHREHLAAEDTDADMFDLAWADYILREALQRVRRECLTKNQQSIWSIFEARLLRPLREAVAPTSYDALHRRYGFDSPVQAANALETAKRKLRQHLQTVIAEYTGRDSASIDNELGSLRDALAHAGARPIVTAPDISSDHFSTEESFLGSSDAAKRLTQALELAQIDSPLWLPDEFADILREDLHSPLAAACDDPDFLRSFRDKARSASSLPPNLATLFSMESPPLWLLELVKRWTKSLLRIAEPPIPKDVAYVLHFACISAGLRAGSRGITRSSDIEVLNSLKLLLNNSWLAPSLRTLFEQTRSQLSS